MIPGTIPTFGSSGKIATYVAGASSTSITNSYTFSGLNFGVYDPTRVLVLAIHWYKFDTSSLLNSSTIGGSSSTSVASGSRLVSGGSGSYVYTALRRSSVTGSSGSVSLSFTTNLNYGCRIGLWALYNVNSATPVDTDSTTSGSFNLTTQPGDLVIAAATSVYDGTSFTWTNATEDYDGGNSRMRSSGASRESLVNGDPSISYTENSSGGGDLGIAAVWR